MFRKKQTEKQQRLLVRFQGETLRVDAGQDAFTRVRVENARVVMTASSIEHYAVANAAHTNGLNFNRYDEQDTVYKK